MPTKKRVARECLLEPLSSLTVAEVERVMTQLGVPVSRLVAESVVRYLEILCKWNRKMNLTAVRDVSEILAFHFAEAFFAARQIHPRDGAVLDIGSGAGLPALAMKLVCPRHHFYLVEARKKRAAFLSTIQRELQLQSLTVINKTIEACEPKDFEAQPSVLTMRAVGRLQEMLLWGLRLLARPRKILLFLTITQATTLTSQPSGIRWDQTFIPWSRERVLLSGDAP